MRHSSRPPVALIVSTRRWSSTVKLLKTMAAVGFDVGFLGLADHPIDAAPGACKRFVLSTLRPYRSLQAAVDALRPDIVVPADEAVVLLLHRLHRENAGLRDLVERSLGAPEHYGTVLSRVAFAKIAEEEGLAVPRTARLASKHGIASAISTTGLPAYVKVDVSCGGAGVVRVETAEDCLRAYDRLQRFRGPARAAWRWAVYREALPWPLWSPQLEISIQPEVAGVPANCAVLAWRGEMLACVEAMALQTLGPNGASSVIRILHDEKMRDACRRLVRRLGLSGLIGFDFMLDQATGRLVVIELNARATQTCHLRLGEGADPPEALRAAVTGEPAREVAAMDDGDIIELFPQDRLGAGAPAYAMDRAKEFGV